MIQISELNIKANVKPENGESISKEDLIKLKEMITVECIENILQILKDKQER